MLLDIFHADIVDDLYRNYGKKVILGQIQHEETDYTIRDNSEALQPTEFKVTMVGLPDCLKRQFFKGISQEKNEKLFIFKDKKIVPLPKMYILTDKGTKRYNVLAVDQYSDYVYVLRCTSLNNEPTTEDE